MNLKIKTSKKPENKINFTRKKVRIMPKTGNIYKLSSKFQPGISIITTTNRPNYINEVFNNYLRQDYKEKELIIVLHNNMIDINKFKEKAEQYKDIKVFQCDEKMNFGECKNFAFDQTKFEYIAIFDDDDYYAPNYLKQSIAPFNYFNCDVVGKRTCFMYFENKKVLAIFLPNCEDRFIKNTYIMDSSMIIRREILEKIRFPITRHPAQVLTVFQNLCAQNNVRVFSTNRFNYVVHRRNRKTHTWDITDNGILTWCKIVKKNISDYTEYVTS